jgi:hypothetical protein
MTESLKIKAYPVSIYSRIMTENYTMREVPVMMVEIAFVARDPILYYLDPFHEGSLCHDGGFCLEGDLYHEEDVSVMREAFVVWDASILRRPLS